MKAKSIFLFFLAAFFLSSCGKKSIDYKEKLEGIWQLSNVPDVLKVAGNEMQYNADALRTATIAFESGGKLITNVNKLTQKGTWSVSDDGSVIMLKAEGLKFDEKYALNFENERTITIKNNGKKFVFKKIKD
jgi:hypothetical protein